jgi:spore germination protein YaaH
MPTTSISRICSTCLSARASAVALAGAVALTGALAFRAPAATAASACAGKAPTKLRLHRHHGFRATLTWRAPRIRPLGSRFRVYRDGRVVGQTAGRSMPVRIQPRRRNRLTVRVVSATGRVLPCRGRLMRSGRMRRPKHPRKLAVRRVTDRGATLTWLRARARDGRIAGYRIRRDRKTTRQVKRLSARVRLSSGRRYRFTVVAVDTAGHVSRSSNAVIVRTRHHRPGPPGALSASEVTDTTVGLGWGAARARSRAIVGYRIFRNGVPLGQVRAQSTWISNLAPATGYSFTVAAVDSLGYLSEATAPLAVTTAMPPPTAGYAHAFLLASTDQSFVDLQAHYRQIGVVYPTYFDCLANTTIVGNDDPLVTGWARLRRMAVMPRVNCQNEQTLTQMLTDSATRSRTLDRIVGLVDSYGYDGINIDFEKGNSGIRDAFTSFISSLASRLHARGKKLSVEVSAKRYDGQSGRPAFYDYRALGGIADYVFVMNWGLHWSVSSPGALDDLPWAREVADYTASMPNKSHFVLGTALYGFDWPNGGGSSNPATALEHSEVMALAAAVRARPTLDPTAYAWHFSYRDSSGTPHDVWYGDATTVGARIQLARSRGLGIGLWRLGSEDQRVWENPMLAPGAVWP